MKPDIARALRSPEERRILTPREADKERDLALRAARAKKALVMDRSFDPYRWRGK